ncbi:MAG: two-component system CheB/CheR fusion protein, partial [Motiliproteus sp.]
SSARNHRQETVIKGLNVPQANPTPPFDITIKPVLVQPNVQGLLMITFKDAVAEDAETAVAPLVKESHENSKTEQQLRQELRYSRESLQTSIEELETSNEELNSTNEELQSTNEELQSTNEEMETSKEELQSLNEESYTVNAELQSRINDLAAAHDDIKNLLDSTNIATLFLDLRLCVRRFTPKATDIIPLTPTDVGRPIQHFVTNLIDVDLTHTAQKALGDLRISEQEVWSKDQRSFNMRVRPYRTLVNVIDGVVLTFEDITQLKRAEAALKKINDAFYTLGNLAPVAIFHTDSNGKYSYANEHWCRLVGMTQRQARGTGLFDTASPAEREQLEKTWFEACKKRLPFKQKYRLQKRTAGRVWVMIEAVPVTKDQGAEVNYIGTLIEIPDDAPNNIAAQ